MLLLVVGVHVMLGVTAEADEAVQPQRSAGYASIGDLHPLIGGLQVGMLRSTVVRMDLFGHKNRLPDLKVALQLEDVLLIGGMQHDRASLLGQELNVGVLALRCHV